MAGRNELCENSNSNLMAPHGETRNYVLEAEPKMDSSQTVDC